MRATKTQRRAAMTLFNQLRGEGYPTTVDADTARHLLVQHGVSSTRINAGADMPLAQIAMRVATHQR